MRFGQAITVALMHLVALAWIYVVLLMAVVEAASPAGSLLGAFFTFLLYGMLPLSIVLYLLDTRARRRRGRQASAASDADRGGHASADPVASVREEP